MRSTLSPTFTSSKMKSFFTLMAECSNHFVNYLKKFDSKSKVSLELKDAFTRYANDVIATCAFGITCNSLKDRNNEFYLMGKEATKFSGIQNLKFLGYTLCPGIMKLLNIKFLSRSVDRFFRNIIKEALAIRKQQNIVRPDMINLLMEAQKNRENVDNGNKISLSDEDITAQALIFFLAGFDTVASAMTFLIYELAINQDIQKKLYGEICTTCEEHAGKINYDIVTSMTYLDSVLSESLRLHSNVPFFDRKCTRPYTIEPVNPSERPLYLEKGTVIWIPTCALHHDEQYFPNPKRFDPERFSESNKQNIRPGAYIPFGLGPRRCIGSRFALLEMKLIIIQLLQHFEIVPDVKTAIPLKPDITSFNGLPSEGVWVAFQPRVI
ncbi:hypothetical protein RI129_000547 [Pyrocoelia pectoralis]|uniref:Cytochrome P450 n=1 Tax=Pyrocoelia pectoralis TaxID=417401 RepID=A0AAN7VT38_9COLE